MNRAIEIKYPLTLASHLIFITKKKSSHHICYSLCEKITNKSIELNKHFFLNEKKKKI